MRKSVKLTLSFFSAYGLNIITHELVHALTAYAFHIPSTVYQFYADVPQANGNTTARILIAAAGPCYSLVLGALCWIAYRALRSSPVRPLLFYLAVFGVSIFLGNLMATAFVGDFATVTSLLGFPMAVRRVISATGFLALSVFTYLMGIELLAWSSPGSGRWQAVAELVVIPTAGGTALVILAFLPIPRVFIISWITSQIPWIFAAIAVLIHAPRARRSEMKAALAWPDYVAPAVTIVAVRILASGINLRP